MAAHSRIHVAPQNRQEQAALDDLRPYLRPWRCTFVDQRDDFGRDGVIQVVDEDEHGNCSMSPLTFWVQCKSSAAPLRDTHSDSVETRHLALWTGHSSSPLVLVLWSAATREFRFRSARSMREELDRTNPTWGDQETVSIVYRKSDGYATSGEARAALSRHISDELDARGGVEQFHTTRRRIVLTNLFKDTVSTFQKVEFTGKEPGSLYLGEGWLEGDLDFYEVSAEHALTASLLLFEEVWVPMRAIGVCIDLLGESSVIDLLERRRIMLHDANSQLGLMSDRGSTTGKLVWFSIRSPVPIETRLKESIGKQCSQTLIRSVISHISTVQNLNSETIYRHTQEDLKRPNLRTLLGMRPHISETEPVLTRQKRCSWKERIWQ